MKALIISVVVALAIIGGAVAINMSRYPQGGATRPAASFSDDAGSSYDAGSSPAAGNVSIVDGRQIIEITAKGGYQPRRSVAKAGMPTIIRFNTKGTFDCSSVVRIPSLNISRYLPQSGVTDIDIGIGKIGTLQGSCGMGMYPFEVEFGG